MADVVGQGDYVEISIFLGRFELGGSKPYLAQVSRGGQQ